MENINTPYSLSDISLGQYQKYLSISSSWGEDVEEREISEAILGVFCGVQDVDKLPLHEVEVYVKHVLDILKEETPLKRFFYLEGVDSEGEKIKKYFGFMPKLDDMTMGEYIDLEKFSGDWDSMHKTMAVLFRPIKQQKTRGWFKRKTTYYTIEDYSDKGVYNEAMKDMPLDVALGALVFFYRLGNKLLEHTTRYIQEEVANNTQLKQTLEEGGVGIPQLNNLLETMSLSLKKQHDLIYTQL